MRKKIKESFTHSVNRKKFKSICVFLGSFAAYSRYAMSQASSFSRPIFHGFFLFVFSFIQSVSRISVHFVDAVFHFCVCAFVFFTQNEINKFANVCAGHQFIQDETELVFISISSPFSDVPTSATFQFHVVAILCAI